jgi:hypothetical protein
LILIISNNIKLIVKNVHSISYIDCLKKRSVSKKKNRDISKKKRIKYIYFNSKDSVRILLCGIWTKKSDLVGPRKPFAKDSVNKNNSLLCFS